MLPLKTHRQDVANTLQHLAGRWVRPDKRILRPVFALLAAGRPVPVARIAEVSGFPAATVEQALQLGRTGRDGESRVVEIFGLALGSTMHRVEIDDVALFSCCALVAHTVPALVGRAATVESVDPVSRRIVRLRITPSGVEAADPRDAVATSVVTDQDGVLQDVGASFCSHVRHFASMESANEFASADPRRYVLGLGDFHEAARSLYQAIWA